MANDNLDLDTESEDDRNKDNYTADVTNNEAYKYRINGYSSSLDTSGNDRGNTHALIGIEDKVSNSSLNSDSSDNENTTEVFHKEIIKRSLLNGPNFRRLSSPAVLGNRESPKQDYYTLQDYLNKNFVRGNSISSPHPADAESGMMMMNYMMSSKRSSTDQEDPKEKRLQKVRLFFIEHCVYKLILCLPFGFLATISILGLKGDPIIFVCYIIIFTLVVFYPFSCLLWLLYKILLPYYQMCRYTPNAASSDKSTEKNDDDTEYNIPTILTEKPTEPTKSLSQTVYERRRSLPARRPSCLPAIEEDETTTDDTEDNEETEESSEKKDNLDHHEENIKL